LAEPEINAFLTHLAVKEKVSASTQNQSPMFAAFSLSLCFGQRDRRPGRSDPRRKPKRLPVVMTREEVKSVMKYLKGDKWLMAMLIYGSGLHSCFKPGRAWREKSCGYLVGQK